MQVTDEMVEEGAKALGGGDWQSCVNDRPMWREDARRVLTAALSDKQAGEVKDEDAWLGLSTVSSEDLQEALDLLPSVLRPSMSNRIVAAITEQASIIDRFKRTSRARRLSFEAARSALVDVPVVEPVAWLPADDAPRGVYALIKHRSGQLDLCYKTDNGEPFLETWRYAGTAKRGEQAPWPESYIPVSELRTSPPLYREGEDSAEVMYAERLATALHEKHYAASAPDWKPLHGDLIGLLTQIDNMTAGLSLAATRSGSATTSSGGEHE
jgi:hypothetical protein